jgi:hypothetical protein
VHVHLFCSVLATGGLAHAEQALKPARSATLVVTRGAGAEDCPAAKGFAERVGAITSRHSLQTDPQQASDTWVYLELNHDFGRYSASLQLLGRRQGSRVLSDVSDNCSSLTDAVAVTLALLLDANDHETPSSTQAAPSTPHEAPSPPSPVLAAMEPRYAVVLGGGAAFGLLAGPAPWATLGVETMVGKHLRFGLGGALALPQRAHYLQGYTELGLAWGYARGCALALKTSAGLELMLCVAPLVGVISGTGWRYDYVARKRWSWVALAGGPQVFGPLAAPAFWWLSAVAVAPLTLRGFAVTAGDGQHDTFVVPRIGAMASLGIGVRF